ncbi:MAG: nicotinamide riboside transporter PnuC [Chitinophagaceae bacterium]
MILNFSSTEWIEITAVIFGILCVYLERDDKNIWLYPTGLISTCLYIYLCLHAELYAEASLNIYYTIMSIWGWVLWTRKSSKSSLVIQFLTPLQRCYSLLLLLVFWIVLYLFLKYFTNSDVPIADSFTAAVAYTAMILFVRKKIEHWILWIITNIASIFLYYYKGLQYTSIQFFILLGLAILGLINWIKIERKNRA